MILFAISSYNETQIDAVSSEIFPEIMYLATGC